MSKDLNPLAVETHQIVIRAIVVAVILSAVVQRRAVGPKRPCHKHAPHGELRNRSARQIHGAKQCFVGPLRGQAHLRVAYARDLVAARGDALGASRNVGAMHGGELFRLVLQYMRRPQGPINARTLVL
jgi:hypothetical protein